MKDYEFCKLGAVIDGIQTVEFFRRNDRPNDPWPESALMRERDIVKPAEDKYCKWVTDHLEAMTQEERDAIDAYEHSQYVDSMRDKWAAENDFLSYIQYLNATYNLNLIPNDGYQDVAAKLEASTTGTELERLKAGVKLGAAWDRCVTHGSTWKNVEWHPEVSE